MKTYKERTDVILEKVKTKKNRQRAIRATIGSGLSVCAVALGLFLLAPSDTNPSNLNKYQESEYYAIIEKLDTLTYYTYGEDLGVLDGIISGSHSDMMVEGTTPDVDIALPDGDIEQDIEKNEPSYDFNGSQAPSPGDSDESYVETTDNQVAGVIEGDRIKRSSDYIYYMNGTNLSIYTIDGENSNLVKSITIEDKDGYKLSAYAHEWEMFLSKDCSTITILSSCLQSNTSRKFVCLINLDVTDPENITETARTYLSGSYLSSRLVDDEILLISHYRVEMKPDFANENTFVPRYGTPGNMNYVPADNIIVPEEVSNSLYTVVCKIEGKTLEAKSTAAFLSYAEDVYVSSDNIYATRYYSKEEQRNDYTHRTAMSEISAISYSGETLEHIGSFNIAGRIHNQYSMDEYEGILRVVTTTDKSTHRELIDGDFAYTQIIDNNTNASLYCVDISTWEVVASVENFAPQGEEVQSVRFDKDLAYVCTAVVLTDPVFVFDLSDLNNITYKDTGTITGYSSSLINFGNGYLLGIGYGSDFDTLKLEIYTETENGVISVACHEVKNCIFADEYKAYFIDREKQLVGLGYNAYDTYDTDNSSYFVEHYSLFQFDGYDFVKVIDEQIYGNNNYKRAVLIDGYFYMFGENFVVREL